MEGNGRGPFQGAMPALFGKAEVIHAMPQEFREANPRSLLQDNSHCAGIEYSCISWLNVIVRRSKYIFVGLKKKRLRRRPFCLPIGHVRADSQKGMAAVPVSRLVYFMIIRC